MSIDEPETELHEERPQLFSRIRSIGFWIFGLSVLACGAMFARFGVVGNWIFFLPTAAFLLFGLYLLKEAGCPNSRDQNDL